jgi:hypothetical protein
MIQKDSVLKGYGYANDVAVLACDAAQRAKGVLANGDRQAKGGQSSRTRRSPSFAWLHNMGYERRGRNLYNLSQGPLDPFGRERHLAKSRTSGVEDSVVQGRHR